jgi:IclR family acetate operon transcriptional repressor
VTEETRTIGSAPPRAATRLLDILDVLQSAPDGLSLRDVAVNTHMPKSTALRYLVTLVERRYVDRDPVTGEYRIGLAAPSQTQYYERLKRVARPFLERLRDQFGEMTSFVVLDRDRIAMLDFVESPQLVQPIATVGERDYIHCTAAGKAIAAGLPADALERVIGMVGLPPRTARTITDPAAFMRDLELTRRRGYAVTDGENHDDVRGVAAAIPSPRIYAAIGLTAPATRFGDDDSRRAGGSIRGAAAQIAESLR